jgi:hypothetical protein
MEGKLFTDMTAGLVYKNLAAKYTFEDYRQTPHATADDKFANELNFGISSRTMKRKLLLAFDVINYFKYYAKDNSDEFDTVHEIAMRFGAEYRANKNLLLRAGLDDGVITAGLGFRYVMSKLALSVDYAFVDDRVGEGDNHIFTFDINF